MKLNYTSALKIKQDFQHLVGQKITTIEGAKEIKEIVVLPINNGSFDSFPFNYKAQTKGQC